MKNETKEDLMGMWVFCVSLIISLGVMAGGAVIYLQVRNAQLASMYDTDIPYFEQAETSIYGQNLKLLLMLTNTANSIPSYYILFDYNAVDNIISAELISSATTIEYGSTTKTLSQQYEFAGARGVAEYLPQQVDRYVVMDATTLANCIDLVGGITYNIEEEFRAINTNGDSIVFYEGEQLLDGRRCTAYMLIQDEPELVMELLKQKLNSSVISKFDSMQSILFDSTNTNMSYVDISNRVALLSDSVENGRLLLLGW